MLIFSIVFKYSKFIFNFQKRINDKLLRKRLIKYEKNPIQLANLLGTLEFDEKGKRFKHLHVKSILTDFHKSTHNSIDFEQFDNNDLYILYLNNNDKLRSLFGAMLWS